MTTTTTPRKLFVNLAIKDATRSRAFFSALGFTFNEQFSTADTLCMVLSDQGYVMLLEEARFKEFTGREVCDTATHTEGIFALSADSREDVDALVHKAFTAGGAAAQKPQDHGFMYGWSFYDLDGHHWEVFWMDPAAVEPQTDAVGSTAS